MRVREQQGPLGYQTVGAQQPTCLCRLQVDAQCVPERQPTGRLSMVCLPGVLLRSRCWPQQPRWAAPCTSAHAEHGQARSRVVPVCSAPCFVQPCSPEEAPKGYGRAKWRAPSAQ